MFPTKIINTTQLNVVISKITEKIETTLANIKHQQKTSKSDSKCRNNSDDQNNFVDLYFVSIAGIPYSFTTSESNSISILTTNL